MKVLNLVRKMFRRDRTVSGAELVGLPQAYFQKQKFQFDFLMSTGLKPNHKFVDIGCGVLRGGIHVIRFLNPGCYAGIDLNEESIAIGYNEVRKQNLDSKKPHLIHVRRSLEAIALPFKVDRAWAFSVLIHMTDQHVIDCLTFV